MHEPRSPKQHSHTHPSELVKYMSNEKLKKGTVPYVRTHMTCSGGDPTAVRVE